MFPGRSFQLGAWPGDIGTSLAGCRLLPVSAEWSLGIIFEHIVPSSLSVVGELLSLTSHLCRGGSGRFAGIAVI
jgi:hypothetical protein